MRVDIFNYHITVRKSVEILFGYIAPRTSAIARARTSIAARMDHAGPCLGCLPPGWIIVGAEPRLGLGLGHRQTQPIDASPSPRRGPAPITTIHPAGGKQSKVRIALASRMQV